LLIPGRTFAVVCGASRFPHLPQFESAATFANSATAIERYLSNHAGAGIPKSNLLWLFDEPGSTSHFDLDSSEVAAAG
jgi:hypothetical protein